MHELAATLEASNAILTENNVLRREEHNDREANRRTGERMVADEVAWLGDKGRELLAAYERDRPTRRLSTFEDVEVLWETVVRPRFGEFRTMQSDWSVAPVPEGSVWRTNAAIPDRS